MANGFNSASKRITARATGEASKLGSRRIFAPLFKLQVLDSYRRDADCKGNQRATARKYGIHRRQIQKWLQAEQALRGAVGAPCAPVDLSLKRPASPLAKPGYEREAPPPPPQRAYRLFRPYLDDNFEEVLLPEPNPPSPPSPAGPCAADECPLACCGQARLRHSYTLAFKLQTIHSYYTDVECRGNQRAVANKFGIHRRQVQKWLQQQERLQNRSPPAPLGHAS